MNETAIERLNKERSTINIMYMTTNYVICGGNTWFRLNRDTFGVIKLFVRSLWDLIQNYNKAIESLEENRIEIDNLEEDLIKLKKMYGLTDHLFFNGKEYDISKDEDQIELAKSVQFMLNQVEGSE